MRKLLTLLSFLVSTSTGCTSSASTQDLEDRIAQLEALVAQLQAQGGSPGPQGEKGDTGDQGATGAPGINGLNGMDGMNGAPGADGAAGMDGAPGMDFVPADLLPDGPIIGRLAYLGASFGITELEFRVERPVDPPGTPSRTIQQTGPLNIRMVLAGDLEDDVFIQALLSGESPFTVFVQEPAGAEVALIESDYAVIASWRALLPRTASQSRHTEIELVTHNNLALTWDGVCHSWNTSANNNGMNCSEAAAAAPGLSFLLDPLASGVAPGGTEAVETLSTVGSRLVTPLAGDLDPQVTIFEQVTISRRGLDAATPTFFRGVTEELVAGNAVAYALPANYTASFLPEVEFGFCDSIFEDFVLQGGRDGWSQHFTLNYSRITLRYDDVDTTMGTSTPGTPTGYDNPTRAIEPACN